MILRFKLNDAARKLVLMFCALGAAAMLGFVVVNHFISGVLADRRLSFSRDALISGAERYPSSARVHSAAAWSELLESDRNLDRAEEHARRAVSLSPYNYSYRALLASIVEARGRRAEAEGELRAGLELAPNDTDLHWQLANLLLRQRRLAESLDELRLVTSARAALLPGTLDLVWRASGGRVDALTTVTGDRPPAQFTLAGFLLNQSQVAAAVDVFNAIGRDSRLAAPESAAFLTALISKGYVYEARTAWANLVSDRPSAETAASVIWNGSFESDVVKNLGQFDWSITDSEYARVSIDESAAHGGARSLRVDFLGRDTTRLEGEIKQLVVVRPGARYRLECFAKAEGLVTPEGPRVVVTDASNNRLAESNAMAAGSTGWQRIAVEFVAPKGAGSSIGVLVTLKRKPRFSYDDPTQGTIRLDDFAITAQ